MKEWKISYGLLACISILFILYALVANFIIDPGAKAFLSHKIGLKRELNLPVWINVMHVHVAFACIAMATGVLNFSNRVFEKSRKLHRINGYVYLVSVLLVVLTSGYMAPYATGGKISSMVFNALNLIWLFIAITALVQIKKETHHSAPELDDPKLRLLFYEHDNSSHHSLFYQGFGLIYATSYTIGVYGSIVLLLIIPNIIIRNINRSRKAVVG